MPSQDIKIHHFMANAGVASRRKSEEMVANGRERMKAAEEYQKKHEAPYKKVKGR